MAQSGAEAEFTPLHQDASAGNQGQSFLSRIEATAGMTPVGAGEIAGLGRVGTDLMGTAITGLGVQGPSGIQTVQISPTERPARATRTVTAVVWIISGGLHGILRGPGLRILLRGRLTLLRAGIQGKRFLVTRVPSVRRWPYRVLMRRALARNSV